MIWHILLATLLTWLVLVGITRVASYLYFELAGMSGEPPKLLLVFTAIVLVPVAVVVWIINHRRAIRRQRAQAFDEAIDRDPFIIELRRRAHTPASPRHGEDGA